MKTISSSGLVNLHISKNYVKLHSMLDVHDGDRVRSRGAHAREKKVSGA